MVRIHVCNITTIIKYQQIIKIKKWETQHFIK